MKIDLGSHELSVIDEGPRNGAPLVLLHAQGTGAHVWEDMVAHMPPGLRIIRPNMRGHGESTAPDGPFKMGSLVRDIEKILERLEIKDAIVCGLSVGGMVTQGLAVKRLDLVRGMVLVNSAARVGFSSHWDRLIEEISTAGLDAMAKRTVEAWFQPDWLTNERRQYWERNLHALGREATIGYLHAIKGTDFYTPTSGLRLPTLGIAGLNDRIVPPDMTRETVELVPGSKVALVKNSGHLTPLDQPEKTAEHLINFLRETGHI